MTPPVPLYALNSSVSPAQYSSISRTIPSNSKYCTVLASCLTVVAVFWCFIRLVYTLHSYTDSSSSSSSSSSSVYTGIKHSCDHYVYSSITVLYCHDHTTSIHFSREYVDDLILSSEQVNILMTFYLQCALFNNIDSCHVLSCLLNSTVCSLHDDNNMMFYLSETLQFSTHYNYQSSTFYDCSFNTGTKHIFTCADLLTFFETIKH
jgi:hypothetical protein